MKLFLEAFYCGADWIALTYCFELADFLPNYFLKS